MNAAGVSRIPRSETKEGQIPPKDVPIQFLDSERRPIGPVIRLMQIETQSKYPGTYFHLMDVKTSYPINTKPVRFTEYGKGFRVVQVDKDDHHPLNNPAWTWRLSE